MDRRPFRQNADGWFDGSRATTASLIELLGFQIKRPRLSAAFHAHEALNRTRGRRDWATVFGLSPRREDYLRMICRNGDRRRFRS
jgi:hypothetical protein